MPFYDDVKEMPLGEVLKNHTGVPVYIQHDISAWTMAEALFGASRGARDVIQVVIDHNVGAGVITDGRLLHAGSSSLVEIGHTQVDPYGKRCYCGTTAVWRPLPAWKACWSWRRSGSASP
jgi:transcriptional regulator of PTS gene